jgi:hypothetical protein
MVLFFYIMLYHYGLVDATELQRPKGMFLAWPVHEFMSALRNLIMPEFLAGQLDPNPFSKEKSATTLGVSIERIAVHSAQIVRV